MDDGCQFCQRSRVLGRSIHCTVFPLLGILGAASGCPRPEPPLDVAPTDDTAPTQPGEIFAQPMATPDPVVSPKPPDHGEPHPLGREVIEPVVRRAGAPSEPAVVLHDIEWVASGGLPTGGSMFLRAAATVLRPIDRATYVHAKARCPVGSRTMADTRYVNATDQRPLAERGIGEVAELTGTMFNEGLEIDEGPCQIEFRLVSPGGVDETLTTACLRPGNTVEGPCASRASPTPLAAVGGRPLEISDLEVDPPSGVATRGGLQAEYVVEIRTPQDSGARLTLKAACPVGDKTFVAVHTAHLMAGPFQYLSGESVARRADLFYDPSYGFSVAPSLCDLEVALWTPEGSPSASYEEILLYNACYRDGETRKGGCPPSANEPSPDPSAMAVVLDDVLLEVVEPTSSQGQRYQLRVQADATVIEPVDPSTSLTAKVACKVGKTAQVETAYLYGVDLHYLDPGETARLASTTFTSTWMEREPNNCEAVFSVGRRVVATGETEVELGRWCLSRDRTTPGAC